MGYNDNGHKAFEASAAIAQYARVALAADGTISTAGVGQDIGTVTRDAFAAEDVVDVSLVSNSGTHYAIASEAISAGSKVYGAASGKVSDTQATGAFLRGVALEAASADGDIIEILPLVGDTVGA